MHGWFDRSKRVATDLKESAGEKSPFGPSQKQAPSRKATESNGKRHDLQRVATTPRVQVDVSYCVIIVLLYGIYIYYVKQTVYIDVAGMIRIILNVFLVFDSL